MMPPLCICWNKPATQFLSGFHLGVWTQGECSINKHDASGLAVSSEAIGLETLRRPRVCLWGDNALLPQCRSSLRGHREEAVLYLIFQLLALYVLLHALEEVVGVEVLVPSRMPEKERERKIN